MTPLPTGQRVSLGAIATVQADPLEVVGYVAALVLALVFVWAASMKLHNKPGTAADFKSLGLPHPRLLATVVPVAEIVIGVLLILWPGWGGVAASTILVMFTTILVPVVRSGRVVSCACFGGSSSRPVTARHLVRNGGLLILAAAAATINQSISDLLT